MIILWILCVLVGLFDILWCAQALNREHYGWATFFFVCAGVNLALGLRGFLTL